MNSCFSSACDVARRPADSLHPFGHGKLLYFYALLVAVYIFAVGAGLAAYEGIRHLLHPEPSTRVGWSYAVLAIAAVFDFYSWRVSYREILARKDRNESTWDEVVGSKDPTVFTVFLEDSAGLAGVFIAFLGIFLGHTFHNPYFDPAASLLIALLLATISIFLGRETGALLAGERTNRSRIRKIREIITADPAVERIGQLLTMQLGPEQALLTVTLKFQPSLELNQLETIIARLKNRIRQQDPTMKQIYRTVGARRQRGKLALPSRCVVISTCQCLHTGAQAHEFRSEISSR